MADIIYTYLSYGLLFTMTLVMGISFYLDQGPEINIWTVLFMVLFVLAWPFILLIIFIDNIKRFWNGN